MVKLVQGGFGLFFVWDLNILFRAQSDPMFPPLLPYVRYELQPALHDDSSAGVACLWMLTATTCHVLCIFSRAVSCVNTPSVYEGFICACLSPVLCRNQTFAIIKVTNTTCFCIFVFVITKRLANCNKRVICSLTQWIKLSVIHYEHTGIPDSNQLKKVEQICFCS